MQVKLISYTNNPEAVVALAARITYTHDPPELGVEHNGETDAETIRRVTGYGHVSIIEHAHFTFLIKDVSRTLTHQLVRHRLAEYSQQSQRFVKFTDDMIKTVTPHTMNRCGNTVYPMVDVVMKSKEAYDELISYDIPPEDARFVLPNATATNILMTMNAHVLLHFFKLRCCNRAQWEIHELADTLVSLVKEKAPTIFENAGSSCVQLGYCPEGDLSCGKAPTMKELLESWNLNQKKV